MGKISFLILMFVLFALAGCKEDSRKNAEEALKEGTEEVAEKTSKKAKEVGAILEKKTEDAAITAAIKMKLADDENVSAMDIDVDTKDKVVTLNGTVKSQTEASRAVEIARSAEGVREVNSRLKIGTTSTASKDDVKEGGKVADDIQKGVDDIGDKLKEGAAKAEDLTADARITAAVKIKFATDKGVSASDIDVDTKDGVVVLKGSVKSEVEATRAVQLARSTDGVKQVVSQLKVGPA